MLDQLIPAPRRLEVNEVDLAARPEDVWQLIRHGDLAESPLIRALFWLRTLPGRLQGQHEPLTLRLDDLNSTPEKPGFQLIHEQPPRELCVAAIGKVWEADIPFVHVADVAAYAAFAERDFVKVAWSLRIEPLGAQDSRLRLEVRVDATDPDAWAKFEHYFKLIGPGSHFIRHVLLAGLAKRLGTPEERERTRALPGDDLLADARAEVTQGITIAATPARIWPWLLQMGCRRAGYYSVDAIDNGGERSSRELLPELLRLEVGQILPATPDGDDGFEVLRLDPPRALILGGLFDGDQKRQLPFASPRPEHFWQVTWAFALEALDASSTRLHVRARAAFPDSQRLHAAWIRPVHQLMQRSMLEGLAARVEGRLPRSDHRDVLDGVGGATLMLAHLLTPFWREARGHWGLDEAESQRARPGDELVPEPDWSWTHGVEIEAPAERVWRWVAQLGADRAGFYSYQWLENLAGCELTNADSVHPEWELDEGGALLLHPKAPPLQVVALERGHYFVVQAAVDEQARSSGKPWVTASWLFQLEPLGPARCRLISRYRASCSSDLATRLAFGPRLLEPISFAMDRRMLLGIKQRAEREARYALPASA